MVATACDVLSKHGVPSLAHEALVELFRNRPQLVRELLMACGRAELATGVVELRSIDLSQVVPTEYRADVIAVILDEARGNKLAVVVEVQLAVDPNKHASWPVYVTTLRARLGCPVLLVVITRDPSVADWARVPIELGQPGFRLAPIVVDFSEVPRITDHAVARGVPELAVLAALAHPEVEVVKAAIAAIDGLPEAIGRLYLDLVLEALPAATRSLIEVDMIKNYEYQSDFARKYYGQGREEGLREGREEGREEVRQMLRETAVDLGREKAEAFSADDEARIRAIEDLRALRTLISALGTAKTSAETDAVLRTVGTV